jgi:hypothetical protein
MGYQEYVYQINDIEKVKSNKDKIINYLKKKNYGENSVILMRFDKELDDINKGYSFYITGCRHYGRDLIFRLDEILDYDSNSSPIEEVYHNFTKEKNRLSDIFKSNKTEYGEVLENWSVNCNYNEFGKYELNDLYLDNDDFDLFLNSTKDDFIVELKEQETIESKFKEILKTYINNKKISMISVIEKDDKYITNILYNYKNKWDKEGLTLRNAEEFTEEEIEEDGIPAFIHEALDSFKVVNLAVFEQIDDNKFILIR